MCVYTFSSSIMADCVNFGILLLSKCFGLVWLCLCARASFIIGPWAAV
jgi:hypothetical protein